MNGNVIVIFTSHVMSRFLVCEFMRSRKGCSFFLTDLLRVIAFGLPGRWEPELVQPEGRGVPEAAGWDGS